MQIRARVRVAVLTGAATDAVWGSLDATERAVSGGAPPSGAAIPAPEAHDAAPDRARFALLRAALDSRDLLHLGGVRHRRALYRTADSFSGRWLAP